MNDTPLTPEAMKRGGLYNWKNQPERLVYLGDNFSGNGYWHQFAKIESPSVVWCEVKGYQLSQFEETAPIAEPASEPPHRLDSWATECSEPATDKDHLPVAPASAADGLPEPGACAWTQEDDEGAWATDCGELFVLNDGVPSENRMRFCCYCGGALTELLVADFAELDAAASPEGTAE